MPNGIPRWIRCYDNGGKTFDRYTVLYTHANSFYTKGWHPIVGMSEHPFHPQGFGMHEEYREIIDRPSYGHLGKKIKFQDLPKDCQKLVLQDYEYFWGLEKAA